MNAFTILFAITTAILAILYLMKLTENKTITECPVCPIAPTTVEKLSLPRSMTDTSHGAVYYVNFIENLTEVYNVKGGFWKNDYLAYNDQRSDDDMIEACRWFLLKTGTRYSLVYHHETPKPSLLLQSTKIVWLATPAGDGKGIERHTTNVGGTITRETRLEEFASYATSSYRFFDMVAANSTRKMMRLHGEEDQLTPCRIWRPEKMYVDSIASSDYATPPIFDIIEPFPVPLVGDDRIF